MKRSILAVVVSAAALLMVGCGTDQTDQPEDTSANTQTDQPKDNATEQPAREPRSDHPGGDVAGGDAADDGKPTVAGAVGSSLLKAITGSGGKEEETADEAPGFQR